MAGRRADPDRARGGEVIQAPRPARARLITGVASVATAAAVGGYTLSMGGTLGRAGAIVAAAGGVALIAVIVLRLGAGMPWAVLLVGAGYLLGREHRDVADGWAAVVGAALLLAAELASWSIDHDGRIRADRALVRQAAILAGLVVASALAGFVLVGAAAVSTSASLVLTAVGVCAAVASVGVVLRLLR